MGRVFVGVLDEENWHTKECKGHTFYSACSQIKIKGNWYFTLFAMIIRTIWNLYLYRAKLGCVLYRKWQIIDITII